LGGLSVFGPKTKGTQNENVLYYYEPKVLFCLFIIFCLSKGQVTSEQLAEDGILKENNRQRF
jgi:hypothetical protein